MPRILALLLFAAAGPASATTIVLQRHGVEVRQGEVCRFRAADRENPFRRWLASQALTCVAAGSPVEFPRGTWNVFARTGDAVSAMPLLVDGETAPATLSMTLDAGASVIALLPEKRGGVIYAPRRGIAYPVDAERVTVPADEELWLFAVEKSTPVALFPIAPIAAGTEQRVDGRGSGPSSVIGWLQIPEADRTAIAGASGLVSPGVRAVSGVVTRDADPLPSLRLLHGAFFRVRDVPAGNVELRLEGTGWIRDRRGVKIDSTIGIAAEPLLVRAAATLAVHWSTHEDLPALDRSLGACEESTSVPLVEISISKCPPARPGQPPEPDACTLIREEKFEPNPPFGIVTLDDVTPGTYRAELRFGKLPPITGIAGVAPLRPVDLRLNASYYSLHGSVTHGGEPLGEEVHLRFPSGTGFAPAEKSEYQALVLTPGVGVDARVTVAACDGSPRAIVLTNEPARPGTRLNIDIPANELIVNVTDTFTREALRGATVRIEVISMRMPKRTVIETTLTADEEGRVTMPSVPVREIRITVMHAGYQKQQVDPFTMPERDRHTVDVQLVPLRGTNGKIVSDHPFDSGVVFWFSPNGSETERADIAADGTFVYSSQHSPEETMAVVSRSHPLWVLRTPAVERRQAISVRFPTAPVRAFEVGLATADSRSNRHIGLEIGRVRVPHPALVAHQTLRRDPPVARASATMRFRDILETGPIDVILGPTVEEVSGRARTMDFFALPQFADAPRERLLPNTTIVVFTVK